MAFAELNGIITQTGTDANLSGLNGITGVTTKSENGLTIYEVAETHRLIVKGTLFHDPDSEILILRHDYVSGVAPALFIEQTAINWVNVSNSAVANDSNGRVVVTSAAHGLQVGDAVQYSGFTFHNNNFPIVAVTTDTFTLGHTEYIDELPNTSLAQNGAHRYAKVASYNYGIEISGFGKSRYSQGCGLIITGNRGGNAYNESATGIATGYGGMIIAKGGMITSSRPWGPGYYDVDGLIFNSTTGTETRYFFGGVLNNFTLINHRMSGMNKENLFKREINLKQASLVEVLSTPFYEVILRNFDSSSNTEGADIGHYADDRYPHRDWIVLNSALGSNVRGLGRGGVSFGAKGNLFVKKEVSFNLKDAAGNAIEGAKMYMQDTPDPLYAKSVVYPVPSVDPYTNYASLIGVNTLGVYNADGTVSYDYTQPITYSATSDANGKIATQQVTTAATIIEYHNTNNNGAVATYGITLNAAQTSWIDSNGKAPTYASWDTTEFGGYYKVDRRSLNNTDADDFKFNFCSYNHAITSSIQQLKGLGELQVNWVMFDDALITADRATADGYTEITTPQAFYNKAKAYLVDNYAGETSTIVSREGSTINAGTYNVTIDANATEVFAFDGTTITIKSAQFVGNITGSGTFTLLNGAEVLGAFGGTTVYPWEVSNVEAGSTLQLFNVTQNLEIENLVVSGTAGTKVTASGSYATAEATVGDTIRLRLTCQAGTTALLPFETNGVATSSGLSLRADQAADTVYDSNNIDGSAITGISLTPDYSNIQIDLDDQVAPYEISAQAIYNYYSYLITTSQGIANFYGAITPIDRLNYRINASVVPLKLQNTGSTDVIINGGRLYRDDNVSVIDSGTGSGTGSLSQDTGMLIQYLQPQVESALNTYGSATTADLTATETVLKKKITQAALI